MMTAAQDLSREVGVRAACEALGVSPATFYRHRKTSSASKPPSGSPSLPRVLAPTERQTVLDTLNSERFVDQAPREVYATLLDEGDYLCSVRTMYRILEENDELRERRNQLRHPNYEKPVLLATGANQVWSWDISVPQQAAREMGVGPPESPCRRRFQTTVSGFGQKPWS